jgi:DNA mismatch repair protein MutL
MQRSPIFLLEEHLINLIAAGEVVENPASCIKELVENSIDASSTTIHIEIQGGGFESIKIMDNGIGMPKEDALFCFERHATSKIRGQQDLKGIATLGFRGEALSSIASISHLLMKTAPIEGGEGTLVEMRAGKMISNGPCFKEHGTTFEIYSLFYNVPARLEFQKTIRGATMDVQKIVQKIALCNPKIRFSYTVDKKLEFDCPQADSLEDRAKDLFGFDFLNKVRAFEHSEEGVRCFGLVSVAEEGQKTRSQQYFFINQRTASSPLIQMAAYEAYQKHFPPKTHPILILFLDIPLDLVDVNVHPQKSIVRLKEENRWYRIVQKALDKAFMQQLCLASPNQEFSQTKDFSFPQWDAFSFPLEKRSQNENLKVHPRSTTPSSDMKSVIFKQTPLISLTGIMIVEGFLFASYEENTVLVDLALLEDFLAKEQILRYDVSIQTECVSRIVRLESFFDLDEDEAIKRLRRFGVEARFISKMTLSVDGLAPCIDTEQLEKIVSEILENPHRTDEALLEILLPKMRKGYLKKDLLIATQAFRELLETKKDFSHKVYVPLKEAQLKRCFGWKG